MTKRALAARIGVYLVCLALGMMVGGCLQGLPSGSVSPDDLLADFGEAMISENRIMARQVFASNGIVVGVDDTEYGINEFLDLWDGLDVVDFYFHPAVTSTGGPYTIAGTKADIMVSGGGGPITGTVPVTAYIVDTAGGSRIQKLSFNPM